MRTKARQMGASSFCIRRTIRSIARSAFVVGTLLADRYASGADFVRLGHLPHGASFSLANDVSADGSVVVGFSGQSFTYYVEGEAFRWTKAGGMVGLGNLPGDKTTLADAVSADGATVVGFSGAYRVGYPEGEALRWTDDAGLIGLGSLSGHNASSALGISADGSVLVGQSYTANSPADREAFRWTSANGMTGLGHLPGATWSDAAAVSADGSVIVGSSGGTSREEAFLWTSAAGMVALGALPGAATSRALAASLNGSVIVGQSYTAASGTLDARMEAFRWTSDEGMVGLGDLPGGRRWSFALDISADGSVIVGSGETAIGTEAFVWDSANGMRSMRNVLRSAGIEPGLTLVSATAVSADGTTIVGYGINASGNTEAWLANISAIPEPSTASMFIAGLVALAACRRLAVFKKRR